MPRQSKTKPRRIPKQNRSKTMVNQLLDATAQVLIREGYDQATTNRIAEQAGVSIGSLYHYFPNKESLVAALNTRQGERELSVFQKIFEEIQDRPLSDAIRKLVKAMVDMHRVEPKLHKVLVEQVPRIGDSQKINEIDQNILEMISQYLQERFGLPAKKSEMVVFMVFHTVDALTHKAVLEQPELFEDEKLTGEVCDMVEMYLASRMK